MKNEILKELAKKDFIVNEVENTTHVITKEFDVNNYLVVIDVTLNYSEDLEELTNKLVSDFVVYDHDTEEEIEIDFTDLELNKAIN